MDGWFCSCWGSWPFPGSSCTPSEASILTSGVVSCCSEADVDLVGVETGYELSRFDGPELSWHAEDWYLLAGVFLENLNFFLNGPGLLTSLSVERDDLNKNKIVYYPCSLQNVAIKQWEYSRYECHSGCDNGCWPWDWLSWPWRTNAVFADFELKLDSNGMGYTFWPAFVRLHFSWQGLVMDVDETAEDFDLNTEKDK
jgi:hypothetical protein